MKIKHLPLLIALSFTGLFVSCNDQGSLGLDLLPNNDGIGVFQSDTFSLQSYTIREDSLAVQQPSRILFGEVNDPEFGISRVSASYQVRILTENIILGTNLQLDSLVLSLSYEGYYGDTLSPLIITVYELDESLSTDSIYYSNQFVATKPTPLASFTYDPRPNTVVEVNEPQITGQDSIFKYAGVLRIPLSPAIGQRILDASGTADLQNNNNFLQFFKGIYIQAERANSSDVGASLHFVPVSLRNGLFLYYKADGVRQRFDMLANNESARRNHFAFDYQGSTVGSLLNDTSSSIEATYVQAGGGVKTLLKMPYLRNLVRDYDVAINKAELHFDILPNSNDAPFIQPNRIFVIAADSNGGNATSLMPDLVEPYYGGFFEDGKYKFIITRYIQQLLLTDDPDYGMVLIPNNTVGSLNRTILGSSNNNLHKPRLVLTFTKLK